MKKAFLLCAVLLTIAATIANAQFIGVDNVSVPLFENAGSTLPVATLYQDSLLERQTIHADEILDWKSQVTSVKDSWFRIIVKTKTGQKEGWTKNYCPNIYGSCESGVVY